MILNTAGVSSRSDPEISDTGFSVAEKLIKCETVHCVLSLCVNRALDTLSRYGNT